MTTMKRPTSLLLLFAIGLSAQQSEPELRVTERYYDDAMGSRLIIRPDVRMASSVSDIELRIFDETHFDNETLRRSGAAGSVPPV